MSKSYGVLILGATAAISAATAHQIAQRQPHARLYLVGRNNDKLAALHKELEALRPGCVAGAVSADLRDTSALAALIAQAKEALGGIDGVLIGHGTLLRQVECEADMAKARQMIEENFVSQVALLNNLVEHINPGGVVAVVSPVAGLAARPGSALYSSTKAALSRYIQGMRGVYYSRKKARLIDVRPGYIATPMTAHVTRRGLFAPPVVAGRDIARAMLRASPRVLYTPWWWFWVMLPIRMAPAGLSEKLTRKP